MTSKGETRSSLGRRTATIILTCTSVWLISSVALAQQAMSAGPGTSKPATSWSLQVPATGDAPHLVIAMAERGESNLSGSDRMAARDKAEYGTFSPPLPTGFSNPKDGALGPKNSRAETTLSGQQIQTASLGAGSKVFSLLSDSSGAESFRYEPPKNYIEADQWSADSVPLSHEVESSPRPLFQVQIGSWRLPVLLSGGAQQ
jgi:hypothetical protein